LPTGEEEGKGGGAISHDGEKAWFSGNHSIISALPLLFMQEKLNHCFCAAVVPYLHPRTLHSRRYAARPLLLTLQPPPILTRPLHRQPSLLLPPPLHQPLNLHQPTQMHQPPPLFQQRHCNSHRRCPNHYCCLLCHRRCAINNRQSIIQIVTTAYENFSIF
jgi:hypothetical protein